MGIVSRGSESKPSTHDEINLEQYTSEDNDPDKPNVAGPNAVRMVPPVGTPSLPRTYTFVDGRIGAHGPIPPEPKGSPARGASVTNATLEPRAARSPRHERLSGAQLPFHLPSFGDATPPADKLGAHAAELLTAAYRLGAGQACEHEAIEQAINPNRLLVQALRDHWKDWGLDDDLDFDHPPDTLPPAGRIIINYFASTPALRQTILNGSRGTDAAPSLAAIQGYLTRADEDVQASTATIATLLRTGRSLTPHLAIALMIEANWSTWEPALEANAHLDKHYDVWPQIMDCEDFVSCNRPWVVAINTAAGFPADAVFRIEALRRWIDETVRA